MHYDAHAAGRVPPSLLRARGQEFEAGRTGDPTGVAGLNPLNLPIGEVRKRLDTAREYIDLAIEHEAKGGPLGAQQVLSRIFPEIVPDRTPAQRNLNRAACPGNSVPTIFGK